MRTTFFVKFIGLLLILSGCSGGDEMSGDSNPNPDAPYFNSIGTQTELAGDQVSFSVVATDPNGMNTTLTYDGSYAPGDPFTAGATFNDSTGEFNWITDSNDTGSYSVRFTATNDAVPPQSTSIDVTINILDLAGVGEDLYIAHCQRCHGANGGFVQCATVEEIENALGIGVPNTQVDSMTGIPNQLNDVTADINAIAFYLGQVNPDPNYCNPL